MSFIAHVIAVTVKNVHIDFCHKYSCIYLLDASFVYILSSQPWVFFSKSNNSQHGQWLLQYFPRGYIISFFFFAAKKFKIRNVLEDLDQKTNIKSNLKQKVQV